MQALPLEDRQVTVVRFSAFKPPELRKIMHYMTEDEQAEILSRYAEGESLASITKERHLPAYGTLMRHLRDNPTFAAEFEQARRLRGIHLEEQAVAAAHEATDAKDTPAARLRFDAYKWQASVNDQSRYGKQLVETNQAPSQIIIVTGVPDNPNLTPPTLDAQGRIIKVEDITP